MVTELVAQISITVSCTIWHSRFSRGRPRLRIDVSRCETPCVFLVWNERGAQRNAGNAPRFSCSEENTSESCAYVFRGQAGHG